MFRSHQTSKKLASQTSNPSALLLLLLGEEAAETTHRMPAMPGVASHVTLVPSNPLQ
jgi:hypothetical protein